jgi:HPt (histidine-containing phosphotransfer) domain-containing protein
MANPMFNLDELKSISGGDERFMKEMVELFITQTESSLADIEKYRQEQDYPKLFSALHKMKPSVQVLGLTSIFSIIETTEKMKMVEIDVKSIENQLEKLRLLLNSAIEELKQI